MVVHRDRLTDELQRSCIRLNDELIFAPQKYGGEDYVHIEVPSTSRFFRVAYRDYAFISLFNGTTTLAAALAINAQTLGVDAVNEQEADEILHWLLDNGMASFSDANQSVDAVAVESQKKSLLQKLNPFWIKLPLGKPNAVLGGVLKYSAWMFHPFIVVLGICFILAGMIIAGTNWEQFSASFQVISNYGWVSMLVGWVALKVIHEIAHGVTCRHFGGTVKETGIVCVLLAPMAYMDVTSSWRFPSRWHRIAVAGAGMYVELILAAGCVFAWQFTASDVLKTHLFNIFLMAGASTVLFNANPLMRFDGYFILSDLLKIPNLYAHGATIVQQQVAWLFYGRRSEQRCLEIKNHRGLIVIYGWLATAWKIMICSGLVLSASVMFGGFGVLLSAVGVVSWFGKPAWSAAKQLWRRRLAKTHTVLRAVCVAAMLCCLLLTIWLWLPNPVAVRSPCVISYDSAAQVRTEVAGFVTQVVVQDGDDVAAGTVLMRLQNRELESQVCELAAELKIQEVRERMAMENRNPAAAQIAVQNQAAIAQELFERQSELTGLTIRAPVAGRVIGRKLNQLQGRYIAQDELLLTIGNDRQKEVLVSIDASHIESTDRLIGENVVIEIGLRPRVVGTIKRVAPQATTQVKHDCLIVPYGGPLAVKARAASQDGAPYRLCRSRFHLIAKLPADRANDLLAGETGWAYLRGGSRTLGQSVYRWLSLWIRDQLESAI